MIDSANRVHAEIAATSEGGNGHYYQFEYRYRTWTQAKTIAESEAWNGSAGYLVTLTSQDESNWVIATLEPGFAFWIGGFQPPDASEPDGDWQWVTGEAWAYANWGVGEPNDWFGRQDAVSCELTGLWDDDDGDTEMHVFIIEFEEGAVPTETSTWGLIKALYR